MRNKTKVFLSFVLISCFFILGGFGCKGLSSQQQTATKPITLEYWTVFDDVDALQTLITKFHATHPYITVNLRQLTQDELYPRLVESLAEDKGPDIVSVSNRSLRGLRTKLATLPETVNDTTVIVTKGTVGNNTTITTVAKKMVSPTQLDREYVQAVKNDVLIDGKIYGLPLSFDTLALYYNKDLLDRAGVAEPPKSWEEFQAAVKKITKYNSKTDAIIQSGAALGTSNNISVSDDLVYVLFRQSGLDFVSKTGQPVFNRLSSGINSGNETPAMSVMNFYTDFANPARDTYTWNENMDNALDAFTNGRVAFFFGYNYYAPVIKARAPQLNVGVLPLLQLNPEQPVNVANYWVQTVTAKSRNQNAAWDLIDYLAHSSATKEYLNTTNRPTALRTYISSQLENVDLMPFVSQALIADTWYRGNNYEAASRAVKDMIHEWLLPAPNPDQINQWRQDILNRAAQKVQQTL